MTEEKKETGGREVVFDNFLCETERNHYRRTVEGIKQKRNRQKKRKGSLLCFARAITTDKTKRTKETEKQKQKQAKQRKG